MVILITYVTPTATNFGAASALPYHLAKYRPERMDLVIYTFNGNNVPEEGVKDIGDELGAEIRLMPLPMSFRKIVESPMAKLFLRYPFMYYLQLEQRYVDEINAMQPDGIWIYSEEWDRIVRQFPGKKIVHLFPDCQSLYCSRIVKEKPEQSDSFSDQMKNRLMHWRYKWMESSFLYGDGIMNCLVGEADRAAFQKNSPKSKAMFLRHPHYDIRKKDISFHRPRIKLLVAGKNNFYMYSGAEAMVKILCEKRELSAFYDLTFLGKDWEPRVSQLKSVGYNVQQMDYVEDYIGEVAKHDIQITPIMVGTGTKGKVLDAIANGLLVIGTPYALENIAVKNGESCIEYETAEQLVRQLRHIPENVVHYERIAEAGRACVLKEHGRKEVSKEMFAWFG